MMVLALLLRPWILQMRSVAAQPRTLADDLLIMATGTGHLEQFEYNSNLTHKHLYDLGAKVAPNKCYTFSSEASARKWFNTNKRRRVARA